MACLGTSAALKLTPVATLPSAVGRREAFRVAALLPLVFSATAVYADNASLAAAVTPEGEAAFQVILEKALTKKEEKYKSMDLEMDDGDRRELESMLRTKYCGFPAEIKCNPTTKSKSKK